MYYNREADCLYPLLDSKQIHFEEHNLKQDIHP